MIAVPVTAESVKEALHEIEACNKEADAIELRLDYLKELSEKELRHMLSACKKPVICTFRRLEEGGKSKASEDKRMSTLKKCMKLGADYIDLEYETAKKHRENVFGYRKEHKLKTRIILSKHFFGFTPQFEELKKLMKRMKGGKADVVKIVTKANTHEDNKIIFALLKEAKREGTKLIAFCMGPLGRDSRILSMPLGSFLTFASIEQGKESADGQIPIAELKKIYAGLRVMF